MTRISRPTLLAMVLAASVAMAGLTAVAQEAAPAMEFSKEFRKKASKVQKAATAKDWAGVLAGMPELEAIEGLTVDDQRVMFSWTLMALRANDDRVGLAALIEKFMAAGLATPEQIAPMHRELAGFYSAKQDAAKTLFHFQSYVEASADPQASDLETVGHLYMQQEQYPQAASWLGRAIDKSKAGGAVPNENWFGLRDRCFVEMGDGEQRLANLEALVRYYPDKEYYSRILAMYAKASNDDRVLMMNAFRVALADAGLATVGEYLAYADTALVAGSPGEAQRALEHGMAAGIVPSAGTNAIALKEAKAAVAMDSKNLPADAVTSGKNPKGEVDVKVGLGFFSLGEYQKSVELVRRGLGKGSVKRTDDANLLLGAALFNLKRYDEARTAFAVAAAAAGEGSLMARVASLWLALLERRTAAMPAPSASPAG